MKKSALLPALLSFAAGVAAVIFTGMDNPSGADSVPSSAPAPARSALSGGGVANAEITPAMLAFAGLSKAPSLEDVLNSSGLEQTLRAGLFAHNASPAELAALLDRLEDAGIEDRDLTDQLWRRWMKIDSAAAMKRGMERGGTAQEQAWNVRAALDPRGTLAAAGRETGAFSALSTEHPGLALRFLRENPTYGGWREVIAGLVKKDPAAAAALALERHDSLAETVKSWALRDPERALAWARSIPPGSETSSERRRAVEFAISGLIAVDPAAGLKEAETLEPGKGRTERLAEAVEALAVKDPEAARAAAEALPVEEDRRAALSALAAGLAGRDPAAALAVLASPGVPWKWQTVEQLALTLPRETAETLAALPREQPLPRGETSPLENALRQWAGRQPEEASAWVKDLPAGPVRDDAVSGLVEFMIIDDPLPDWQAALVWAKSTSGVSERLWTKTLKIWGYRDYAAVQAYLNTLPLTEEERRRIEWNIQ